jgi:membrane dipeptidase
MKWLRWITGGVAIVALVWAWDYFVYKPVRVAKGMNWVNAHEPYEVTPAARTLHGSLRVADLHADALWPVRDMLERNSIGHVDIPRLQEGGFALQVFSVTSSSPKSANKTITYEKNSANEDSDSLAVKWAIAWGAIKTGWPPRTWGSITERAIYRAGILADAEQRSNGAVRVVRSRSDLNRALDDGVIAGILLSEGAHPLEGDLANLDRMYDAGFRVLGLQHFFDNELGGSLHGVSGAGLTDFGRSAIRAAEKKEMIIDIAHSSEASARDALAVATRPMIVSHTGFKGHCDTPRNFPDELMKEIAAAGGLIGVGFWDAAVCEPTLAKVTEAIVYGVNLVGAEQVALGSDFDGAGSLPFDASEMAALTSALLEAGLDENTVGLVMGENIIRFFATHLPED